MTFGGTAGEWLTGRCGGTFRCKKGDWLRGSCGATVGNTVW